MHEETARPLEFYRTNYTIQFLMWWGRGVKSVLGWERAGRILLNGPGTGVVG